MSFEKALLKATTLPSTESTRAIVWLAIAPDVPGGVVKKASKKAAAQLSEELNQGDPTTGSIAVTSDILGNGYFVDTIQLTDNRFGLLSRLVEATDKALLNTLEPAEVEKARFGAVLDETNSYVAWEVMGTITHTDATAEALEIASQHRQRFLANAGQAILYGLA